MFNLLSYFWVTDGLVVTYIFTVYEDIIVITYAGENACRPCFV